MTFQKKHGKRYTPIYGVWAAMLKRCNTPSCQAWKDYGGRGITVCERWFSFENFYADMGDPQKGMQLERRNNDGPYSPSNCFWASAKQQARNRRSTVFLTIGGKKQCAADWITECGIHRKTFYRRLRRGWTPEEALSIPPRQARSMREAGIQGEIA